MITRDQVLRLYYLSIQHYGGSAGIRDGNLLDSAIARPFQTFDGIDLYSDIHQKAAAIVESILINHPFMDGNKRTGLLAMAYLLDQENIMINASNSEIYNLIIGISTGSIKFDEIVIWLKEYTQSYD